MLINKYRILAIIVMATFARNRDGISLSQKIAVTDVCSCIVVLLLYWICRATIVLNLLCYYCIEFEWLTNLLRYTTVAAAFPLRCPFAKGAAGDKPVWGNCKYFYWSIRLYSSINYNHNCNDTRTVTCIHLESLSDEEVKNEILIAWPGIIPRVQEFLKNALDGRSIRYLVKWTSRLLYYLNNRLRTNILFNCWQYYKVTNGRWPAQWTCMLASE